jgi:hypothetical protein
MQEFQVNTESSIATLKQATVLKDMDQALETASQAL